MQLRLQRCTYSCVYILISIRSSDSLVIKRQLIRRGCVRTSTKDVNKLALQFRALELDWLGSCSVHSS